MPEQTFGGCFSAVGASRSAHGYPGGTHCWCGWCPSHWGGGQVGQGPVLWQGAQVTQPPCQTPQGWKLHPVRPSPLHLPLLFNHLQSLCPSELLRLLPTCWLAAPLSQVGASPLQGPWATMQAGPGLSPPWRPSQPCRRETVGSSPERLRGTGRLLAPPGQAAHLCLQGPVAVAAEDGHGAGTRMPEAGSAQLPPSPLAASEPADPAAPGLLLYPPGAQGPSCSWRELPLVTQLQTARGYF